MQSYLLYFVFLISKPELSDRSEAPEYLAVKESDSSWLIQNLTSRIGQKSS